MRIAAMTVGLLLLLSVDACSRVSGSPGSRLVSRFLTRRAASAGLVSTAMLPLGSCSATEVMAPPIYSDAAGEDDKAVGPVVFGVPVSPIIYLFLATAFQVCFLMTGKANTMLLNGTVVQNGKPVPQAFKMNADEAAKVAKRATMLSFNLTSTS